MPVAMVGYKLRQIQAQSPIKAPKHIKPRLTKGKRNWQRQRSDFKRERDRNEMLPFQFSHNGNFFHILLELFSKR